MIKRIPALLLFLLLGSLASGSARASEVSFYSGGEKIYGDLSEDWVAVKLGPAASIGEVRERADKAAAERIPLPPELAVFEKEGITFIHVAGPREQSPIDTLLRQLSDDPDVEVVGRPLYLATTEVPLILTDEFVVQFKSQVTRSEIDQLNSDHHVQVIRQSPHVATKMILRVTDASAGDAAEIANSYYESGLTEFSHPNFIVHTEDRFVPNDALYPDQWHLNNTGQRGGTVDADIDAEEAWDITRGSSGIILSVIDSGVQIQHQDLQPNQFTNAAEIPGNGIDDDGNGYADDVHGWNFYNNTGNTDRGHASRHGTAVAGLAAGKGDNTVGISGVCADCTLLPIARGSTVAANGEAFDYAAAMGADIITNSWGYTIGTPATDVVVNAINDAATNGRGGLGAVITFAMTNGNVDNCDPAGPDISALDTVIAISRSDDQDVMDNAGFGDCMELLSPTRGAGRPGLTTTDQTGADGYNAGDYHNGFGGTSGATPQVAGIAGLMLTLDASLTREEVRTILIETADKIDAVAAGYDAVTGFSDTHGYGRVNAFRALCQVVNCPPTADPNGPYSQECDGATTDMPLDGTGSSDPNPDDILTYSWTTTCPEGSFDDPSSAAPVLTVSSSGSCSVLCGAGLTVTDDEGAADADSADVTIEDTSAPQVACPGDVTIECDEPTDPGNTGFGTASDVCDPDPVVAVTASSVVPGECPEESVITRTWTATDVCSLSESCDQTINVVDTTAPEIDSISASPSELWPPNHKMRPVEVSVVFQDLCDEAASCQITSVSSNEPENGAGDGNTAPDWAITGDLSLELRAERSGGGSGRIYTIGVTCTDACENSSEETVTVAVPHDKGKRKK